MAHVQGAYVILDCFQSAGAEAIDVTKLGVDFAVGGMFKYLLGTAGIGFLYAREELVRGLVPTASGWFAQNDSGAMNILANSAEERRVGTECVRTGRSRWAPCF